MKLKPILFSTPMVKAILTGEKTQTRRIMKPQPVKNGMFWHYNKYCSGTTDPSQAVQDPLFIHCKYGEVGDILWVRETFAIKPPIDSEQDWTTYLYKTDDVSGYDLRWKPSIFMPREVCRLFLEITNIRVERLQDISERDAIAEGIQQVGESFTQQRTMAPKDNIKPLYENFLARHNFKSLDLNTVRTAKESYSTLWEKINGPGSWDKNPWVWIIEFKRIDNPCN